MSILNLPTQLTLHHLQHCQKITVTQQLKNPFIAIDSSQTKKVLNKLQAYRNNSINKNINYPDKFIMRFLLIKINSICSTQCSININFIQSLIHFWNTNPKINIPICQSDAEIFSFIILIAKSDEFLTNQELNNVLEGDCIGATTAAMITQYAHQYLLKEEIAFSLSFITLYGHTKQFTPIVHAQKNHSGQLHCAKRFMELLGKQIELDKDEIAGRLLQDSYSLRCAPQVHGVAYDALNELQNNLKWYLNKMHFHTITLDGKEYANMDLYSDKYTILVDFLILTISEIGSMSFLRSERILNTYLGINKLNEQNQYLWQKLRIFLQNTSNCTTNNKLLCNPINTDTINIYDYQKDIFYNNSKMYQKVKAIIQNLNQIQTLEIICSLAILQKRWKQINRYYNINQELNQHYQYLQKQINFQYANKWQQIIMLEWQI